jgi:GST-like protein
VSYLLFGRKGWGSAIAEAQLEHYGLPFRVEEVPDLFQEPSAALAAANPVAQVPTLVLPGGEVMTESAAITLHLADVTGSADLVPAPAEPERARFLRWLVFLVANVYPTFTYADDPARFCPEACAPAFKTSVFAYRERLWRAVEAAAEGPCFLGDRFSALDVYLGVMTRWTPREDWFRREAPKLWAAAERAWAAPRIGAALARHFG